MGKKEKKGQQPKKKLTVGVCSLTKGEEPDEKRQPIHPMHRTANWCSHGRWFTLAIDMGYNGNVRLQQQTIKTK